VIPREGVERSGKDWILRHSRTVNLLCDPERGS